MFDPRRGGWNSELFYPASYEQDVENPSSGGGGEATPTYMTVAAAAEFEATELDPTLATFFLITSDDVEQGVSLKAFPMDGGVGGLSKVEYIGKRVFVTFLSRSAGQSVTVFNQGYPQIPTIRPTALSSLYLRSGARLENIGHVACFCWNGQDWFVDLALSTFWQSSDKMFTGQITLKGADTYQGGANGQSIGLEGGAGDDGGNITLKAGPGLVGENGQIIMLDLPGTDPGVEGALWNDSGVLKVSGGVI